MKRIKLLICVLCLILCCGCWDKHELEDQTFVVMMGLDKADNKNIVVTVAFPTTQTEGGNGGGGEKKGEYSVASVKAPSVVSALNMFSVKLAGPLSLFSAKTVVISQELAKDDMLRNVLTSWRYEQMRNNTNVLVSSCTAAEFIGARMENSAIDPLRQEDLILEQANYSAYYKAVQFLDLIINLKSDNRDAIAMYGGIAEDSKKDESNTKGNEKDSQYPDIKEQVKSGYFPGEIPIKSDNKTQICGLAVFRGGRMVGALDSSEAQIYAMMTKSKTRKILTLPDPLDRGSGIDVSILPNRKSDIRCYLADGKPVFDINADLHCTVECIQSDIDYTSDGNYAFLTEYIRQTCEQDMRELIVKLQKEYRADLLRLGEKLAYNFPTNREWEAYDWPQRYPDAEIRVNVKLDIDRTGIFKP